MHVYESKQSNIGENHINQMDEAIIVPNYF